MTKWFHDYKAMGEHVKESTTDWLGVLGRCEAGAWT